MTQRDRRVRLLAGQQNRHRFADDVRAADHHGMLALDVHPRELNQLNDAVGRTGQETFLSDQHLADVDGREAVHVLLRRNRIDNRLVADVLWHRQLDEDAVNRGIDVQVLDELDEFFLGRRLRQTDLARIHARFRAGLLLRGHVAHARRIVADENDRETGRNALLFLERLHSRRNLRAEIRRQLLAIDDIHARIISKKDAETNPHPLEPFRRTLRLT